jgi:hypothetical protein
MQRTRLLICAIIIVFLAACQSAIAEDPVVEVVPPTDIVHPTVEETVEELASMDYCLECHAEKEKLVSTAKPEVVLEAESKGVG